MKNHSPDKEIRLLPPQSQTGPGAVLIYPNSYSVGMSSLALHQVYRHFAEAGLSVQRAFYDEAETDPRSFEMREPIFRFPLVAYSLTYEPDILHIVRHLNRSGIPPLWRDRDEQCPVVLVGGLGVAANPALAEEFADVICTGEGEMVIPHIAAAISAKDLNRKSRLEKLAEQEGLYVPPLGFAENRFALAYPVVTDLETCPCHSLFLTPDDEFGGAFLIEVSRGCSHRCKFCLVSHRVGQVRFRSGSSICGLVNEYGNRIRKVGLMGAAVSDHPDLTEVAEYLVGKGLSFSCSSLRADRLTDDLLALLRKGGNQTITLAPESGDEQHRRDLGKPIKDLVLFDAVERAGKVGFSKLRFYWLIGTPNRDLEGEIDAIIGCCREIERIFMVGGGCKITCIVSPWVPKAFTPFAGESMASAGEIRRAIRKIRRVLAFRGGIHVPPQSVWEAQIEGILSVRDRDFVTSRILRVSLGGEEARSVFC